MSDESETVEAFFEGAENVYDGATDNFNSQRVVLREKSADGKHFYTNKNINNLNKVDTVTPVTGTFTPPVDGGPFTIGADQMTYTGTGDELELSVTISWFANSHHYKCGQRLYGQ